MTAALATAVTEALARPFAPREVKFKPQSVKGNRALALAYTDCRVVQDRLDEVLGVGGWQDEYHMLPDGSVMCRLRLKIGEEWITKVDVGSPSEQPDGGDRMKAAFSDALKRAAVKFGIGRYLYRLPATWADYDPVKKQFVQTPQLPKWALPEASSASPGPAPAAVAAPAAPVPAAAPVPPVSSKPTEKPATLPKSGAELERRLRDYDSRLASQKLCNSGGVVNYVTQLGVQAGYSDDLTSWSGPAIAFAVETVKQFEATLRSNRGEPRQAA